MDSTFPPGLTRSFLPLFLVTGSILCFEVALTRIIAIQHWHHLVPVIIAIALTGFGAAGTLAAVLGKFCLRHFQQLSFFSILLTTALIPLSPWVAASLPFNMLAIAWQMDQLLWLVAYACCFLLPFFFGAFFVTLNFIRWPQHIGKLYAVDLSGSASGGLLALWLLSNDGLQYALWISCGLSLMAALMFSYQRKPRFGPGFAVTFIIGTLVVGSMFVSSWPEIRSDPFKELSTRLNERDAQLIWQKDSQHSRLSLVKSHGLHAAPGLSINSRLSAPQQLRLFVDGDGGSPLIKNSTKLPDNFMSQTLGSAAYRLATKHPRVLIEGGNASWQAWTAHQHQASSIDLVHSDKAYLNLLAPDNQKQIAFVPDTTQTIHASLRRYLQASDKKYDVIFLSLPHHSIDLAASEENYSLTSQAMQQLFSHTSKDGILAFQMTLHPLPKDSLRLSNTIIHGLKQQGTEPSQHLAIFRDWRSLLIVVTRQALTKMQVEQLTKWSNQWRFDKVALPGLTIAQTNRFHQRINGALSDKINQLIGENSEKIENEYIFNLEETSDNAPYFYQFFRWDQLTELQTRLGSHWLTHISWGYLLTFACFILLSLVAGIFILLPLKLNRVSSLSVKNRLASFAYFSAIGLGFMWLEILLIIKSKIIMDAVTSSMGIVVTAMLLGTGTTSWLFTRKKQQVLPLKGLLILLIFTIFSLPILFDKLFIISADWNWELRGLLIFVPIYLSSLLLGIWLPNGILQLKKSGAEAVAWAWGINGFASVIGALTASILAMHGGLYLLSVCSAVCYLAACFIFNGLKINKPMQTSHMSG